MKLTISNDILSKLPDFNVIAYTMDVDNKTTEIVTKYLKELEKEYNHSQKVIDNLDEECEKLAEKNNNLIDFIKYLLEII